jgi:hypothetical protein
LRPSLSLLNDGLENFRDHLIYQSAES